MHNFSINIFKPLPCDKISLSQMNKTYFHAETICRGEFFMQYIYAFLIGGILCVIAQILIDKTKLTPARILVIYVTAGVILTAIGLYEPLVDFAGAGATVPLTGFGYALAKGIEESVAKDGFIGAFSGGLTACSAGIAAAVFFGFIMALIKKPSSK